MPVPDTVMPTFTGPKSPAEVRVKLPKVREAELTTVAGREIVIRLVLVLAVTVVPAWMPAPLTPIPTVTGVNSAAEVTVVASPKVSVAEPVTVAAFDMVMELVVALAVTVVPTGMPVPLTVSPTATGPKSAAEVTVVLLNVVEHARF